MRGPYKNRESEYARAIELRRSGYGYRSIANEIDVPWRTVCGWVQHIPVDKQVAYSNAVARRKRKGFPIGKSAVRLRLIEERGNACQLCGLDRWLGEPIMLEVHRKKAGGGYTRDNVVLLCPNCHSTTDTWRNKKRGGVAESADAPDLKSGS
jgi:5-methylcytosine-specific restriction endonuclease McrA